MVFHGWRPRIRRRNVVLTLVPAFLVTVSLSSFEVLSHEIEYSNAALAKELCGLVIGFRVLS